MKIEKYLIFLSAVFFTASFVFSQELKENFKISVGQLIVLKAYSPKRIFVRNPSIVDVVKVTTSSIEILGKKSGFTDIEIWDDLGKRIIEVEVYKEDLEGLKERLTKLIEELGIKGVKVRQSNLTDKVIVEGEVEEQDLERIKKILAPLGERVENLLVVKKEKDLVEIDVQILEISRTELDRLGIKWNEYMQFREEPYVTPSGTQGVETTLGRIGVPSDIFRIVEWSRDAITSKINLLISKGKAKILSRPKLLCLSGEEAHLLVGGEVPIVTVTTATTGTSTNVEYKEYGIGLKIRPQIMEDNQIKINLNTEVSEIDWANAIEASGIRIPAFTKRSAQTQLYLKSGQIVFIAGLIKNEESKNIDKIPALGSLPVIGALFRSKDFQTEQTELVISLTPKIIKNYSKLEKEKKEQILKQAIKEYKVLSPAQQELSLPLGGYIENIKRKIALNIHYPQIAKESGWQGTTILTLHLLADGSLLDVSIKQSSGYKIFDEVCLRTVKKIGSFPPFPSEVKEKELWIDIPIVYRLY